MSEGEIKKGHKSGEFSMNLKREKEIIYVSTAWRGTQWEHYSQDVDDATQKYCEDHGASEDQGFTEEFPCLKEQQKMKLRKNQTEEDEKENQSINQGRSKGRSGYVVRSSLWL